MSIDSLEKRRDLLAWLLGTGALGSVLSFLYPVARFLVPPRLPEATTHELRVGTVDQFPTPSGTIIRFGTKPVLLLHLETGEWRAFSAECTHLSCTVRYQPDRQRIWCACHNGVYDLNGHVVSGPPPRPLEPYRVHIRGNEVILTRGET